MLISDIIEFSARKHADRIAVRFEDEIVTYAQLRDRCRRLANALRDIAAPGDRVAILSASCTEYFDCYYGVPQAGMALTILNFRLHPSQLAAQVEDAGASVLIVSAALAPVADEIGARVPGLHRVIVIGGEHDSYADFVADAATTEPPRPDDNDLGWLVYTSGTTGQAKGVMISHRNLTAGVTSSALEWAVPDGTVFLFCFPMCHIGGYVDLIYHLVGGTVGIVAAYDNTTFLRLVDRWRVTQTGLAPTMINFLLCDPSLDEFDLGSLEAIGYGAAAIPAPVLEEGLRRLRCDFYQGMGMTELAGNVLHLDFESHRRAAAGETNLLAVAGRPMRLVDIRVVDDDGADVATGEVGEMIVRGDQVMSGYWHDPDATAAAFTDGWFHTGDLVRQDDEGYVAIVDRKKDLIISGGENVASLAVEQALHRNPHVAEAAVVGTPDETWGEVVCAVVVLRDGQHQTADEIITAAREHLGGFQVPRRVEFADSLPRNVMGKVVKRDLRESLAR